MTSPSGPVPRVLVVVAHPDDETFGTGSVLLHAAAAGAHTGVVCATRGEAGEVVPGVELPVGGVAGLREAELRAAADALGVAEVDLLAFADSGMDGTPAPGSLCGAPYADVVEAVSAAVERFGPDVVVTLDGSDGHRDHVRVRDAVVEVVTPTAARLYLHCLPRSLMHEWVRHKAGMESAAAYVDLPEIGTPDEQITTRLDTGGLLERRRRAIALHASQSSPFDGLPEDLERRFLGTDHLIRVSPPWTGGETESDILGNDAVVAGHPGAATPAGRSPL